MTLFNLPGENVTGLISVSDNRHVHTENLAPGVYFLEIKTEDRLITQKIVKR
jgi:hypothetical protein